MTLKRRSLSTPGGELVYTIAHRPRVTRRMHLELDTEGELLVVVPADWPAFYTRGLLRKNLAYVHRFLNRARPRHARPLSYIDGSRHLLAGSELELRLQTATRRGSRIELAGNQLRISLADHSESSVRGVLQRWYLDTARQGFARRLAVIQELAPWARNRNLKLALRRMKRTWGTCSSAGVIRLNTHLIKAPETCLDYVISHELCHLQEMNHGPAFYRLQEAIWPDWRQYRRHLREHGNRYTQE